MFCIFSWKKEYIKNCDAILLSKYDSAEKDTKLWSRQSCNMGKKWRISLQTIFFTKKVLSRHVNQVGQNVAEMVLWWSSFRIWSTDSAQAKGRLVYHDHNILFLPSMVSIIPSVVLENLFLSYFPYGHTLNYDLALAAILDFRSAKQVTTLG
jgi:hypothetical protein